MHLRRVAWLPVAMTLFSVGASAQESREEIARRELLTQAETARTSGDHTRALDFASRAGQIRMTPSIRLMLAQEHNSLGHVLDALDHAGRCVRDVEADPALPNRDRILTACRALATSLQTRVGTVTVHVPDDAPPEVHVRVQGGEISRPLWGVPCPVTPGSVLVEATGPGDTTFRRQVTVDGGGNVEVTVSLASATRSVPVPSTPVVTATASPVPVRVNPVVAPIAPIASTPAPERAASSSGPGLGPWVVGGVGVVAMGLGAVFFGLSAGAVSSRNAACGTQYCEPAAVDFQNTAVTDNLVGWITMSVGAAAVAGGVVWLVTGRSQRPEARPSAFNLRVTPTAGGAFVGIGGAL